MKLELIRCIDEFPRVLHEDYAYRLDFFTPNFSKYINIRPNGPEDLYFVLTDTITGKEICDIP